MIVPMFHVNAWGTPYASAMAGTKLVLPGPALDGRSVYELLRDEKVTLALGVPTVWLMLLQYVETAGVDPKAECSLRRVVIGGSAAPRAMSAKFDALFGAFVVHAWGMTEMSPLGTVCNLLPKHRDFTLEQRLDIQMKQGRSVCGVELKICDDEGRRLPHDGKAFGHLMVRGPWVTSGYYKEEGGAILDSRRLFRHRRRRDDRSGRLHADHRSLEGRDQVRRRVDLVDRARECRDRPSGDRRSGRDRRRAPEVAGTSAARRREEGRAGRDARAHPRVPRRQGREVVPCPTMSPLSTNCRTPRRASC